MEMCHAFMKHSFLFSISSDSIYTVFNNHCDTYASHPAVAEFSTVLNTMCIGNVKSTF